MKKLLTILTLLVAFVTQGWADEENKTIWEGSKEISWNTNTVPGESLVLETDLKGIQNGNTLYISYATYGEPQYSVKYKKGNDWTWTDIDATPTDGVISITVSSDEMATEIKDRGLIITGQGYMVTKIQIGETDVWTGYKGISWNTDYVPGEQWDTSSETENPFTNLENGNTIKIHVAPYGDAQFSLGFSVKNGSNYDWTSKTPTYVSDGLVSYTIESDAIASAIATSLTITGQAYKVTKVEAGPVYTLTKNNENGSLTVVSSRNEDLSSETNIYKGSQLSLTASTNVAGYVFDKWTDGTTTLSVGGNVTSFDGNVLNITMNSDMSVTALFKLQQFTVTAVSEDNEKGTVSFSSGSSGDSFDYGTELTLTASQKLGYSFKGWKSGEETVSTDASYTFTVTGEVNLIAKFEAESASPNLTLSWEGSQTLSDTPLSVPASEFTSLAAGTMIQVSASTSGTMKITSGDITLFEDNMWGYAYFEVTEGNLESLQSHGISITGETTVLSAINKTGTYTEGNVGLDVTPTYSRNASYESNTITFTGTWGYQGWYVGDNRYNTYKRVDVKFSEATSIAGKLNINYINNTGRVVTASEDFAANSTSVSLNIPTSGIVRIAQVFLSNGNDTGTLKLQSVEMIQTYSVTISDVTGGTISVKNGETQVNSGDQIDANTELTLTAEPDGTHNFNNWVITTGESTDETKTSTSATYTVNSNVTIGATFAGIVVPAFSLDGFSPLTAESPKTTPTYDTTNHVFTTESDWTSIQLYIGNNSTYSGSKLVVKTQEEAKLRVTVYYVGEGNAASSYSTATKNHVVDIDSEKKIDKVIIDNTETGTVTFTEFALDPVYTLTKSATTNGSFTVSTDGGTNTTDVTSFAYGTTLTFTATADPNNVFSQWSDEATENPHNVVITDDLTMGATFISASLPVINSDETTTLPFALASDWTTSIKVEKSNFADAKAGDVIKISVSNVAEGAQISLKDNSDGWPALEESTQFPSVATTDTEYSYVLTATTAAKLRANDFIIGGHDLTVTAVNYTPAGGSATRVALTVTQPDTSVGSITVYPATSDSEYEAGAQVVLTATPADGYNFVKWSTDATDNPYTYTVSEAATISAVFQTDAIFHPDGKADLSKFVAGDGATYSYADGKGNITTTGEYKGIYVNLSESQYVQGTKVKVKFEESTSAQVHITYSDGVWDNGTQQSGTGTEIIVPVDNSKQISQIYVQLAQANATANVTEVSVINTYTLTTSATNGSITVKQGDNETTETEFAPNTELTLTALPNENYTFSKWTDGENELTKESDGSLNVTMSGDKNIVAVFESETTSTPKIDNEGKVDLSQFTAQGAAQYNSSTATLTASAQWQAIQLWLNDDETKSGSELVVKFVEDALAEVVVTYTDDTSNQVDMSATGKEAKVSLDNTKQIRKIEIKNAAEVASGSTVTIQLSEVTLNQTASETRTEKTLVTANVVCGSSDEGETETETIPGYKFENAVVGDEIVVHVSAVAESGACIIPKYPTGSYPSLLGNAYSASVSSTDTEYRLALTSDMITSLKSSGLKIYGNNLTIGDIALYTESELGTEDAGSNYTLTTSVTPEGKGSIAVMNGETDVTSTTSFASGTTLKLIATATADNYKFSKWTDGTNDLDANEDKSLTLTMDGDKTITAVFETDVVISDLTTTGENAVVQPTSDSSGTEGITVTSNSDGVEVTTSSAGQGVVVDMTKQTNQTDGEDVQGKRAVVEIKAAENSTIKVTVNYTDGSKEMLEKTITATASARGKALTRSTTEIETTIELVLDPQKKVSTIEIQNNTEASSTDQKTMVIKSVKVDNEEITKSSDQVTKNFVSLIDSFGAEDETVTYSEHVMTTTVDNKYIQAWISNDNISGKRLVISATGDNPPIMNILVQYNGENEKPITYAGSTSTSSRVLKLDDTKTIQKVQIYLPTKGSVTFNEIYIDNEDNSNAEVAMFKLTTTSVNGQITVKKVGETANTADREFEYDTQLTLTATANEGYEFVKWMNGETELTANSDESLSLTMDADVTIEAVFKLSMLNNEDSRTLWTGSENLGTTWPAVASQSATVGDILEEGEKILITVSSIEKNATDIQVVVRSADYNHTLGFSKFDDFDSYPAEVKLILSAGDVTAFKSGFHITGTNCIVTKVVLYKPTPVNRTERTLLEKTQAVGDGIEINRGLFSNAAEEDVLKVYFEVASGTAKINLEDMNYNGIENSWPEITTSPYTYIFSAKALSKIKASGLRIRGENFTFKKATLYTVNELGSEIIDSGGDDGGDDNPQPTPDSVIDSTTGEVDTEAFQAMGDNATFDAETGVMTTTEPWAGVQAWFNEPESVPESANVIVVKIRETNIVVQVTVGYTDGTESQAISTVGGSVRQKARRIGSSGIDIIVPVDPEKEIQKIVIQAAEPGTITINSITARTQTLFTDGKVDLSMLKAQGGKVTYDTSTHTMATTAGWTGVSMTVTSGETVKGVELYIRTTNPATMKMAVEYADGTQRDSIMTDAASIVKMQLDATKLVKTIYIQPTAAAIIQFQEISVNATHTPDIFNPVFTNGKADLSRLAVQDADRVMYNAETHKMVTTDGWIGVQLTPDKGEKVSGAELMVKFAEPVTMKLAVVFSDGSQCDTIMSEASKELKLALDNTLEITQIQLQPTSAAVVEFLEIAVNQELTPDPEPEPLIPVFDKNGKADLSRLDVQDANRVMYNKTSHKLATTDGWVGVQLSTVEGEKVSGAELMVKFAEPAVMKLVVAYSDGSQCDTIMSEASTELKLALDNTLEIAQIQLQPTSATVVELLEIAVNQERTPDPEPEPVVPMFDKDGNADLSRLEVQDADRVMYNTETHKMATTDGWVGVQFSTVEGETATGAEIALLFAQPATVKLTVKYTDETQADTIMSQADTLLIMPLDIKKPIAQVQIQPTSAGVVEFLEIALHQELTPIPEPVIVRLFDEKGQGNLSVFEPMSDNAEYDQNTHVLTTMENWAGVQVWLDEPQTVNGNTISVRFAEENANARIVVGYTDGSESAGDAGTANATETGTEIFIAHDSSKEIQKMMIQMPVAGKLTLTGISSISYSVSPLDVTEKRLLWKNDGGETLSWNDIAKKGADYGAILETGEMILVTVKSIVDGNEWPKLFLRDAQSEIVGEEMLLNGIRNFPYQARFTLDAEMKAQMADGFSLCGDGVVVTRVELYKPEPPKEGDINLVDLNGGWNSTYDAASHTITTTARWAARGWDIGDARYNDMDVIIVRFEPVAFPVTLKIEYTDAEGRKQATSNGVAAGNTAVEISIPKGIQTVDKVYLVLQNPGSVTLTAAEVLSTGSEQIKLDLGSFEAMGDNVTYDNVSYTMTSADAWVGIQLWLGGNTIDGGQLIRLTCADETAKVRLSVGYTDGTETSVDAEGSVVELELDDLRSIQKVAIQNQEAGTLVLKDITITTRTIDEVVLARQKSRRASTDNSMYSIGGSKVNTPNGGLYIQNGKKVVVK